MPKPIKRQQWSNMDVFGLLNGISTWDPQFRTLLYVRSPIDTNLTVRDKIFRLTQSPQSLTKQGLLNGISSEFGYNTYNVESKNIFELSYDPFPSGANGVQDVWVEYRDVGATGSWTSLSQIWSEHYEEAKLNQNGFIVWQNEKYVNISGVKNFNYSRVVEVLADIPDNQELRISYYIRGVDQDNNLVLTKYTDMDNLTDPYTRRFTYRKPLQIELLSGVTVYTLNDIPSGIFSRYYDEDNLATEQLYILRDHIRRKYKHTWEQISDASVIWDIHKQYGSGNIPHYFDSCAPLNDIQCLANSKLNNVFFSGFLGGIEDMSQALYLDQLIESGEAQDWYFTLYPGTFYLDGTPFYLFENPQVSYLTFVDGVADLPSGVQRGSHIILALSGYYDGCVSQDPFLSGFIFEDHTYPVGDNGDSTWSYIYRRRGFVPSGIPFQVSLDLGEYNIDFESSKVYSHLLDADAVLIWDNVLIPSGRIITYDINPIHDTFLNKDRFFLYLVNKET